MKLNHTENDVSYHLTLTDNSVDTPRILLSRLVIIVTQMSGGQKIIFFFSRLEI